MMNVINGSQININGIKEIRYALITVIAQMEG
jgi:hypothetical protein